MSGVWHGILPGCIALLLMLNVFLLFTFVVVFVMMYVAEDIPFLSVKCV